MLYSRGESFDENRFYSDPGDWPRLAETHRREFLERTDRGVFSLQAEATLNQSRCFRTLAGRAVAIDPGGRQVLVTIEYGDEQERVVYDLVVVAIGFEARWFESLLGREARARLVDALAGDELERRIDIDLGVEGLRPRLHLPMLAGLAQGPGFPNLSCLGLLSDRVLRSYVAGLTPPTPDRLGGSCLSETPDEVWESDELVRRTITIPRQLAERLAAEAERRDLGINDLIVELAEEGLPEPVADD